MNASDKTYLVKTYPILRMRAGIKSLSLGSLKSNQNCDHLKGIEMLSSMWLTTFLILTAGAVGGAVNAFVSDNGFFLPESEVTTGGATLIRPGYLGNCFVGAIAAVISWGLYGPASALFVVGTTEAPAANGSLEKIGLSLASFVGALLVGVGGARWLSNEVDKNLLRATAAQAAGKRPSNDASQQIAMVSPAQALNVARTMK